MFADSSRELLKNELEKDLHKKINSIWQKSCLLLIRYGK